MKDDNPSRGVDFLWLPPADAAPRGLELAEADGRDFDSGEVVLGEDNFLPAWFLSVGAAMAAAVCKVDATGVNYQGAAGAWSGTGFLIAADILLTNNHVLNSVEVARAATCAFNYQIDRDGAPATPRVFALDPDRLFLTSPALGGLDFTFVAVKDRPGDAFGWIALERDAFAVADRDYVNIIQHPSGRPKALVLQDNRVRRQDQTVIQYTSDTEPGSSGSCAFNNRWTPVALHHASKPAPPADVKAGYKYLNEGIKFSAIVAALEQLAQGEAADARMARQALAAVGPGGPSLP